MGFQEVGWKYYLVIICWSAFFIPGKNDYLFPNLLLCRADAYASDLLLLP